MRYRLIFLSAGLLALSALAARAEPALELSGDAPKELTADIKLTSNFFKPNPPVIAGQVALKRQVASDLDNVQLLLNNFGYYDPVVDYQVDSLSITTLKVDLGPRYQIGAYNLGGMADPPSPGTLGINVGEPAMAPALVRAEAKALNLLAEAGYPLAHYTSKSYVVDHDAHTLDAALTMDTGPKLNFGEVAFSGNLRTRDKFMQNRIPWQNGQAFKLSQIEAYRRALLATELFNTVKVTPATTSADGTTLPVDVEVTERQVRTISGSLGYDTDRGPGGEVSLEHRNLWGSGERLNITGTYYAQAQSLGASLRVPDWFDRRTVLLTSVKANNEQSDAYNSTGLDLEAGLERTLSRYLKASAGAHVFTGNVDDDLVANLQLPFTITYDNSNSPLDPTKGFRASSTLTPVIALRGEQSVYAIWEQRASGYVPLSHTRKITLGLWGHVGGVFNATVDELAKTSRFYAGGGGSVRGYDFRSIGNKDSSGDPLGGAALAEGGTEVRFNVTDTIGGVVFAEAGSVSDSTVPNFSRPQYAAGFGVRYNTSIAPLRADIAVPLNPRDDDPAFQFYISLGQAF